jgi:hypothetical protein
MKKVSLVIAVIAFLISGLTVTAQPPISITKKTVTKPAPKQKESVQTVKQSDLNKCSQVGGCAFTVCL